MKSYLIVPLSKSPNMDAGRVGPKHLQDWYVGLQMALKLKRTYKDSQIAIITDFKKDGQHEADIYEAVLREGGSAENLMVREGLETIGQIEIAKRLAKERGDKLIIVSTFLHRLRVSYYSGKGVIHHTAWGIPRLIEIPRDSAMIFLAPLIRRLNLEKKFLKLVTVRREKGIL